LSHLFSHSSEHFLGSLYRLHYSDISLRYEDDPYLAYRPAFARCPSQILLSGVVLTLTAVFIDPSLYGPIPLAICNRQLCLALSGVTILLISLIAAINVVLSAGVCKMVLHA
jgi:hypothetical protein